MNEPKDPENEEDLLANPQPTDADGPPIPQPPTDAFPAAEEDLTSRVPGTFKDVKKEAPDES
jgi:hypothetical protein